MILDGGQVSCYDFFRFSFLFLKTFFCCEFVLVLVTERRLSVVRLGLWVVCIGLDFVEVNRETGYVF